MSNLPSMVDRRSTVDILKEVSDNIHSIPLSHKPSPTPREETQRLLNLASESVDRIFDHGIARVNKIEEMCRIAKQALESKRKAVNTSMAEYLKALDLVQTNTEDMDKALSLVMLHTDAFVTGD